MAASWSAPMSGYEGARWGWFSPTHPPLASRDEIAANVTRDADTTNGSARRVSSSYDFWEHEHAAGVAQKIRHVVQMKLSPPHLNEEK